jgi:hypothetical protein
MTTTAGCKYQELLCPHAFPNQLDHGLPFHVRISVLMPGIIIADNKILCHNCSVHGRYRLQRMILRLYPSVFKNYLPLMYILFEQRQIIMAEH